MFKSGHSNVGAKLTRALAQQILNDWLALPDHCRFGYCSRIAREYGITQVTVFRLVHRESWQDLDPKVDERAPATCRAAIVVKRKEIGKPLDEHSRDEVRERRNRRKATTANRRA